MGDGDFACGFHAREFGGLGAHVGGDPFGNKLCNDSSVLRRSCNYVQCRATPSLSDSGQIAGHFISTLSGLQLSGFQLLGLHFQVGLPGWLNCGLNFFPVLAAMQPDVTGSPRCRKQQRPERDEKNNEEPAHEDGLQQAYQRGCSRPSPSLTLWYPAAPPGSRSAILDKTGCRPQSRSPGIQESRNCEAHAAWIRERAIVRSRS
jgi:hypothetical protein